MKYLFISFNLKLFLNFFTMHTIFVIGPINFSLNFLSMFCVLRANSQHFPNWLEGRLWQVYTVSAFLMLSCRLAFLFLLC